VRISTFLIANENWPFTPQMGLNAGGGIASNTDVFKTHAKSGFLRKTARSTDQYPQQAVTN
jgi:hypothetical protein